MRKVLSKAELFPAKAQAFSLFAILAGFLVAFSIIEVLAVALSILNVQLSQFTCLMIIAVALGTGIWQWRSLSLRMNLKTTSETDDKQKKPLWFWVAIVFSLIIYTCGWLIAVCVPDVSFDGNLYHVPAIHQWALKGHVCWAMFNDSVPGSRVINGYPKGIELFGFVFAQAFGHWTLINAGNLMWLSLGVLGVACIALELGAPYVAALVGGMLYLLIPVNISQMTNTYNDSGFASATIAFIAVAVRTITLPKDNSNAWRIIPLLGGALGLAISAKPTGLMLIFLGTILVVWLHITATSGSLASRIKLVLPYITAVLLIANIVGGFWYWRNLIITGNPTYPVELKIAHHTVFEGSAVSDVIDAKGNTPVEIRGLARPLQVAFTWFQGLGAWPKSIFGVSSRLGGLGFIWIVGCVPAICWMWASTFRQKNRNVALVAVSALVVMLFMLTPLNWWARYTLWIYALGLPCLAVMMGNSIDPTKKSRLLGIWIGLCICIAVAESGIATASLIDQCIFPKGTMHSHIREILAPGNWKKPYFLHDFPELENSPFEEILASSSAVALGPLNYHNRGRKVLINGWLSKPIGKRVIVYISKTDMHSANLEKMLREKHIRWVIWDTIIFVPDCFKNSNTKSFVAGDFRVFDLNNWSCSGGKVKNMETHSCRDLFDCDQAMLYAL